MKLFVFSVSLLISSLAFANCLTPWGLPMQNGESVQAYLDAHPLRGQICASETRICVNELLTGSYFNQTCTEDLSCDGPFGPVPNGSSLTAYLQPIASHGQICESEIRFCNLGLLSGSYSYASCSKAP